METGTGLKIVRMDAKMAFALAPKIIVPFMLLTPGLFLIKTLLIGGGVMKVIAIDSDVHQIINIYMFVMASQVIMNQIIIIPLGENMHAIIV